MAMKEKLYRFMQGRYGADQLNRFIMILSLLVLVISLFGPRILYVLGIALLILAYYRMLSKNIYRRRAENSVYLKYTYKIKNAFIQNKTYHIYKCPSCKQKIRIPRGKGRIEIRCPKCSQTFIKKS